MRCLRSMALWLGNGLATLGLCLPSMAAADVWGYVNEQGVAHFASHQVDERYELFFRAALPAPAANADSHPRPVLEPAQAAEPVGKLSPKLAVFFEVSPVFKGVRHLMREAAASQNIDIELLQALIVTESGFDPAAVSPRGAVGLMQIMPATAERYGVSADAKSTVEKKLTDPAINIRTGSRYLRYLMNLFPGRLELAIAAYNAGEGAVQRAGNSIPKYRETQDYVKTVMQIYAMLKPPATLAQARRPTLLASGRQRTEISASAPSTLVPTGGARGRGNMVMPLVALESPNLRPNAPSFEP